MNIEELKKVCNCPKSIIMGNALVRTSEFAALISAYEGANFAAESHLRTVKAQQVIIAEQQREIAELKAKPARELTNADIDSIATDIGMGKWDYCNGPQSYWRRYARAVQSHLAGDTVKEGT